jgi:PAS domain S-box-containing protein
MKQKNSACSKRNSEAIKQKQSNRKEIYKLAGQLRNKIKQIESINRKLKQEIEKRKSAEQRISESLNFTRKIIDSPTLGIIVYDSSGQSILANEAAGKIIGATKEQVLKQNFRHLESWKSSGLLETANEVLKTGKPKLHEIHTISTFGKEIWIKCFFTPFAAKGERCLLLIVDDVSERRKMERELLRQKNLFEGINRVFRKVLTSMSQAELALECLNVAEELTSSKMGFIDELNEQGKLDVLAMSDTGWEMCRIPKTNALRLIKDIEVRGLYSGVIKQGKSMIINDPASHPDRRGTPEGHPEIRSFMGIPLKYHERTIGIIGLANKEGGFTDPDRESIEKLGNAFVEALLRRKAEEALAYEKERLMVTLRSIGDGVIATDISGKVVLMNKVAEMLTGWAYEQANGRPLSEIFHIINEQTGIICEDPVQKVLKTNEIVGLANNTVLISRQGTERIIADSGAPIRDMKSRIIGVVLVCRDITEKRRMQQELEKRQKIESLGILAGGIAHDFNNILTAVLGYVSLSKVYARNDSNIFDKLSEAEKAVMRAKDMTQQLLTFSKGGKPLKKIISIAELIKDTALFALRGSNVKSVFSIPDNLWSVDADDGQISQVIQNIVINADQSMPEGGFVNVNAENIKLKGKRIIPLPEGNYVRITVKDHGMGIPEEFIQKIYDPYFTTKQKGSGLGLTISYSIIKNHQGHISVESKLGKGSTFSIYIPAASTKKVSRLFVKDKLLMGSGKILIMDDEKIIRNVASDMLKYLGYDVECVENGEQAIEKYKKAATSGEPFDLVILDLTVPGSMGGMKALKKLIEIDPDVKGVVSSGYSNDPIMADCRAYGFIDNVKKPYKIEELSEKMHTILSLKKLVK